MTTKGTSSRMGGFKAGNSDALISKILARKSGETFIRSETTKTKSRKGEQEKRKEAVKEGMLAVLYAQHVLGQQLALPGTQPPMDPSMGMDPSMMGGMPPQPPMPDPNAQGLY